MYKSPIPPITHPNIAHKHNRRVATVPAADASIFFFFVVGGIREYYQCLFIMDKEGEPHFRAGSECYV